MTAEKYHSIVTIKDIVAAVNEDNLDGFLTDFRMFLELSIAMRAANTADIKMNCTEFQWQDDGDYGTLNRVTLKFSREPERT